MLPTAGFRVAALAAGVFLGLQTIGLAHDGPHRAWLERLMRPDNDRHPERQHDRKSLFCCGEADIVKPNSKSRTQADPTRRTNGTLGCMRRGS
jgi:hypothetical protein